MAKDWTPRQIVSRGLCTNSCLNATGRERHACECPRCLGLLHAIGADQPIRGSGVRVAALLALLAQRGDAVADAADVNPDDGALIPLASVTPRPDTPEVTDAAG
jgi:hypothetical protein